MSFPLTGKYPGVSPAKRPCYLNVQLPARPMRHTGRHFPVRRTNLTWNRWGKTGFEPAARPYCPVLNLVVPFTCFMHSSYTLYAFALPLPCFRRGCAPRFCCCQRQQAARCGFVRHQRESGLQGRFAVFNLVLTQVEKQFLLALTVMTPCFFLLHFFHFKTTNNGKTTRYY